MGIACSSSAAVKAAGRLGSRDGVSRNARRRCGVDGSTEHVASTAASRVHVAVLGDGWVWLGDGVGRHCDGYGAYVSSCEVVLSSISIYRT